MDSELAPDEYAQHEEVGNLGSYIGEYIGSYGEELFERNVEELIFRSACWATGTQMLRFSNGANDLISSTSNENETSQSHNQTTDSDSASANQSNKNWSIRGIGRITKEGESVYDIRRNTIQYREIDGAEHLDPPNYQDSSRPRPSGYHKTLSQYLE